MRRAAARRPAGARAPSRALARAPGGAARVWHAPTLNPVPRQGLWATHYGGHGEEVLACALRPAEHTAAGAWPEHVAGRVHLEALKARPPSQRCAVLPRPLLRRAARLPLRAYSMPAHAWLIGGRHSIVFLPPVCTCRRAAAARCSSALLPVPRAER